MIRLLFLLMFFSAAAFGQKPPAQPPAVRVAAVQVKPMADQIEALGTLAANESVDLTAKVTETITSLNFTDGQRVKKGDLLATMNTEEAQALLEEAQSTAEESLRQYDRTKQLSRQGAAAAAQLDEARRVYETARARQLAIQSRIDNLTITAPFDGVVGLRNISVGALVQPGDLITTIDDDSGMKLDFSVPATFLPVLVPGAPIEARARAAEARLALASLEPVSHQLFAGQKAVLAAILMATGSPNDAAQLVRSINVQQLTDAEYRIVYGITTPTKGDSFGDSL